MMTRRLLGFGLSMVSAIAVLVVLPTSAHAREWTIDPVNPVAAFVDPFGEDKIRSSDVEVRGLYDEEDGSLWLAIWATPQDGYIPWTIDLTAPSEWFSRPRTAKTVRADPEASVKFDVVTSMGCNGYSGRVDLHDIARDDRGRVTRIWLDWQASCDGYDVHGYVRWGYPTLAVQPTDYAWKPTLVGRWGNAAWFRAPSSLTDHRIEGRNAADFRIVQFSGCSSGPVCRVLVSFRPVAAGHRQAALVLRGATREVRIPLEGTGLPGVTRAEVNEEVLTGENAAMRAYADRGRPYARAWADADRGGGYDLRFDIPGQEDGRFVVGTTYVDSGGSGPDIDIAHAAVGSSTWTECRGSDSTGRYTFRQLYLGSFQPLALVVDFEVDCGGRHVEGTVRHGARTDMRDPARVASLRRPRPGVLAWSPPADAVRTVVRARRGGLSSQQLEDGESIYSGPGSRIAIPSLYVGKATSYTVFTLDATGNVSAPRVLVARGLQRVTLAASRSTITAGRAVRLTGRLADAGWGYHLASRSLVLETRVPGGRWSVSKRTETSALGRYAFTVSPGRTRDYRVRAYSTPTYSSDVSGIRRIFVR